jgi:hypothetical protein
VLVLGSHFATPSAGYVVQDGNGWRFVADAEKFKAGQLVQKGKNEAEVFRRNGESLQK